MCNECYHHTTNPDNGEVFKTLWVKNLYMVIPQKFAHFQDSHMTKYF